MRSEFYYNFKCNRLNDFKCDQNRQKKTGWRRFFVYEGVGKGLFELQFI